MLGGRESVADVARNLGRFVDGIMARTGPHEVVARARRPGRDPGRQRADHPRASVPDARRPVHPPRAVRRPSRLAGRVRRRRQQRLPLAGADGRDDGHGDPPRPSGGLRAERAHRGPGSRAGRGRGRAARVRRRSAGRRPGRGGRLHGRVDVDGAGGRGRGAPRRVLEVPGQRRLVGDGARRARHALSPRTPRRGDHVGRDGRPAKHHLRPVGEPAPRAEGAAGRAPRGRAATDERQAR